MAAFDATLFAMRCVALALLAFTVGCRDANLDGRPPRPPGEVPHCGDGNINADLGEECDGSNLGDKTCQTQGFDTGTLVCTSDCKLATATCVKRCGNGLLDLGEECDGNLGPLSCPAWGAKSCT